MRESNYITQWGTIMNTLILTPVLLLIACIELWIIASRLEALAKILTKES
jgi:hypothetical protein